MSQRFRGTPNKPFSGHCGRGAGKKPSVLVRWSRVPIVRPRAQLVAVRLVNDPRCVPAVRVEVGVRQLVEKRIDGARVTVWGDVEWLDTRRYRDLLTEAEARAWMAAGFDPPANDPRA